MQMPINFISYVYFSAFFYALRNQLKVFWKQRCYQIFAVYRLAEGGHKSSLGTETAVLQKKIGSSHTPFLDF